MLRRPWLLLLLLPLLPLFHVISQGHTVGPFDQIRQMAPWRADAPVEPWDVLQADGVLQFYVWRDLVLESWSQFQLPFWNPYQLAGTPLMANSQSGALYPPHILLGVLHVPTPIAVIILAWFHLALAGLGAFRLVRSLGGNDMGALLAGSSFMLSPFLVGWTVLSSVPSTVAWIPWALALLTESMRGHLRRFLCLGFTVGMMGLAGHLQFLAYGLLSLLVWGLWLAAESKNVKTIAAAVLAVGGGLALAGPQLLPVLSYSQFSHRRNTPTEEGYQAYVFSAIRPFELGNLVNPMALGNPREAEDDAYISTYWPALVKRGGNWAESAVSPGAVALAGLCFFPLVFRRLRGQIGAPLALGALSLLLALGTPVNRLLYFGVPGWSSTGSPGRIIILFVLMGAVIAGLTVGQLLSVRERPNAKKVQLATLAFALLSVATIGIGIGGAETPPGIDHGLFQVLVSRATATGGLAALIIAAIAIQPFIYGYFRGSMLKRSVMWIFPAGVAVTALLGGIGKVIPSGKPLEYPRVSGFERIAVPNENWGLVLAAKDATLPPNTATLFRVHDIAGYDSLLHRDTVAMLNDINGQDSAPQANGNIMFIKPTFDKDKLGEAGVTQMWSAQGVSGLDAGDSGDGVFRQPIPGPGRVSSTGGEAKIVAQTLRSITIEATGPGNMTLRDRNMPGWTATVNGSPTPITGDRWREVELPEGTATVVFRYTPPGFGTGFIALLVGLGALLLASRLGSGSAEPGTVDEPSEAPEDELASV